MSTEGEMSTASVKQHPDWLTHAGRPTSRAVCQAGRLLEQEQIVSCAVSDRGGAHVNTVLMFRRCIACTANTERKQRPGWHFQ